MSINRVRLGMMLMLAAFTGGRGSGRRLGSWRGLPALVKKLAELGDDLVKGTATTSALTHFTSFFTDWIRSVIRSSQPYPCPPSLSLLFRYLAGRSLSLHRQAQLHCQSVERQMDAQFRTWCCLFVEVKERDKEEEMEEERKEEEKVFDSGGKKEE